MRSYGAVAPTFWTRGSGKKLRGHPDAQVVALYLMSAPSSSMTGLYYLTLPSLAYETGISEERVRVALARVAEVGIAHYDEAGETVWVPEMARYQIDEQLKPGDKRIKGVIRELEAFRGHPFVADFVAKYGEVFRLDTEPALLGALTRRGFEGASEGLRSQDQDKQDQEHVQDRARARDPSGEDDPPAITAPDVVQLFRELYPGSRRGYGPYAGDPKCDLPVAERVAAEARRLTGELIASAGVSLEELGRSLLTHWIRAYLADNGSPRYDIVGRRHPLSMLASGISEYQSTWRAKPRSRDAPGLRRVTEPVGVGPPLELFDAFIRPTRVGGTS